MLNLFQDGISKSPYVTLDSNDKKTYCQGVSTKRNNILHSANGRCILVEFAKIP